MDPTEIRILTGQTREHLTEIKSMTHRAKALHMKALNPFSKLREQAAKAGFDLQILSGFRSFDHQLSIWNRKARGELEVLDSSSQPLDIEKLSPKERAFAIARWSALPGASRHHWGTDIDVFDAKNKPKGYKIQLIPEEVRPGGMFGPMHHWIDQQIQVGKSFGFLRPYDRDRGGVAPERWHLSFAPQAKHLLANLTLKTLESCLHSAAIELKSVILDNLGEMYERFVLNINKDLLNGNATPKG